MKLKNNPRNLYEKLAEFEQQIRPRGSRLKLMLLWSGRSNTRWLRYGLSLGLPILAIWSAVGSYIFLSPKSYTSEMTLNLPGAVSNSNLSLAEIGQASTSSGSAFASNTMSPKVIYKTIAMSPRVLGTAAKIMGSNAGMIAKPRITLIDETSILEIAITGSSPAIAQESAKALLEAVNQQLDGLRNDEAQRRTASVEKSLVSVAANLKATQDRLVDFQRKARFISADQFQIITNNAEALRQKTADLRAELEQLQIESKSYSKLLGISAEDAAIALQIQADPLYTAINAELAQAMTEDNLNRAKWGSNHPKVVASTARLKAARSQLARMVKQTAGSVNDKLLNILVLTDSKDRAELFHSLIVSDASAHGVAGKLAEMERQSASERNVLKSDSGVAAELAALERNHKIAEAVFSSALARIDTNKQDIFASYPMLQVIAPASLPTEPSSPKLLYALAGGLIGTFFVIIAMTLVWIRQPILRKILKSV